MINKLTDNLKKYKARTIGQVKQKSSPSIKIWILLI